MSESWTVPLLCVALWASTMSLRASAFGKVAVGFAMAHGLGKTLVFSHEPEDLPISVIDFKFSRKDEEVCLLFITDTVLKHVVGAERQFARPSNSRCGRG